MGGGAYTRWRWPPRSPRRCPRSSARGCQPALYAASSKPSSRYKIHCHMRYPSVAGSHCHSEEKSPTGQGTAGKFERPYAVGHLDTKFFYRLGHITLYHSLHGTHFMAFILGTGTGLDSCQHAFSGGRYLEGVICMT